MDKIINDSYRNKRTEEYISFWKSNISNGNKNILYIDIPFCVQRCEFCIFDSNILTHKSELDKYIENRIIPQIEIFNDVFCGVAVDVLYFGGGTASLLSEESISLICEKLNCFKNIEVKAFEAHPDTMTVSKMELLLEKGFNYFSFGIQTFDELTLKKINRVYVTPQHIKNLVDIAHSYNAVVSVDLISYLTEWDSNELQVTARDISILVRTVIPDCITIHMNYKKYRPTKEVIDLSDLIKMTLLSTDYFTNIPEIYDQSNPIDLGCNTHNIYHGDFIKICKAKNYNCSGPGNLLEDQNVYSIGGFGCRMPYSYIGGQRQWYICGEGKEFDVYEVKYNTLCSNTEIMNRHKNNK